MLEENAARLQKTSLQNQSSAACRSAFGYIRSLLTRARPWQLWTAVWERLRGIRVIAFSLKVLTVVLSVLGNVVPFLLSAALFLVILPLLVVLGGVLGVRAWIELRRHRTFFTSLGSGRVYVLFPTEAANAFARQNIASLACRGRVILISPRLFSAAGIYTRERRGYAVMRCEGDGIWLMRAYMLPRLRRRLRANADAVFLF